MSTFSEGYAAYELGDYQQSFEIFSALAKNGDLESQISLAEMYYLGRGVQRNAKNAAYWYGLAAESGHPTARHNHAMALLEHNPEEGIPSLLAITELSNNSFIESALGDIYSGAYNLPENIQAQYRDDAIALQWYLKAGKNGFSYAYHKLAKMYLEGRGDERNVEKAILYLEKAAEMNYESSIRLLVKLYTEGLPDLEPDEEKAAFWTNRVNSE